MRQQLQQNGRSSINGAALLCFLCFLCFPSAPLSVARGRRARSLSDHIIIRFTCRAWPGQSYCCRPPNRYDRHPLDVPAIALLEEGGVPAWSGRVLTGSRVARRTILQRDHNSGGRPKPSPAITASLKLLLAKRCVTACLTFFLDGPQPRAFEPLVHGVEAGMFSTNPSSAMLNTLPTFCEGPAGSKINDKNACMHRTRAC